MKILVTFEIKTPYIDWRVAYDNHKSARLSAGINDIYAGHDIDNTASIICMFEAPSVESFTAFMTSPEVAAEAQEAGHMLETTRVIGLS